MSKPRTINIEIGSKCQRCGSITYGTVMSYFNTDMICLNCSDIERAHPDFEKARRAEYEAVKRGDYNFPGIGKPADL